MDLERINKILDEKIKNCTPDFKNHIISILEKEYDFSKSSSVKNIVDYIRKRFNISRLSSICLEHWLSRGHSEKNALAIMHDNKKKKPKRISVYSKEFWLAKINPLTNTYYTEEESDYERNSRRPIRKEYWMRLGYTEEESIIKAKIKKDENNKKGSRNSKNALRINNNKTIEYWTIRGYSKEEAMSIISQSQKTFSLDICIEKYGYDEGYLIWYNRQQKWKESLNNSILLDHSKKTIFNNMKNNTKDEIIDKLKEAGFKNINVSVNLFEFKEYLDNLIDKLPYYAYTDPLYVFNKLKKHSYYFLGLSNNEIIDFISKNIEFKTGQKFFYDYSKIKSYKLFTKEGYYLRSSHEINFYEKCKNNNISIMYEGNYTNSTLKYDFFIKDINMYVEIAGMLDNDDYYNKMIYKQTQFCSIILLPERIDEFIQDLISGNFDRANYKLL